MTIPNGIESLFEEKSLLSVYKKSIFLSENRLDFSIKALVFVALSMFCLYVNLYDRGNMYVLFDALIKWSDIGFSYSVQILGFLLAGFTIFATTTDIRVFIGLSKATNKTMPMNQLKFLFFSFLKVFIVHLAVLIMCVIIVMIRPIARVVFGVFLNNNEILAYGIKAAAVSVGCVFLGCFLISALLQLKTFVWNLYQSVIFSIASSAELASIKNTSNNHC